MGHVLCVDSKTHYGTFMTLHYRNKVLFGTVQLNFEPGALHALRWIHKKDNIADYCTKRNRNPQQLRKYVA